MFEKMWADLLIQCVSALHRDILVLVRRNLLPCLFEDWMR